jgi:peptidylprolyl isomerase
VTKTSIIFLVVIFIVYYFVGNFGGAKPEEIAANQKSGAEFMETNKAAAGVKTTSSGLQYLVLKEGAGAEHPLAKDRVTVHY